MASKSRVYYLGEVSGQSWLSTICVHQHHRNQQHSHHPYPNATSASPLHGSPPATSASQASQGSSPPAATAAAVVTIESSSNACKEDNDKGKMSAGALLAMLRANGMLPSGGEAHWYLDSFAWPARHIHTCWMSLLNNLLRSIHSGLLQLNDLYIPS